MPFVKRDVTAPSKEGRPPDDNLASHVAALSSPDSETRWSAARALGGRADAVPALAAALAAEPVARVREAIMTALMRVGDEASVMALLPYLRSQDAALRGASIEALQALPEAILPL
ncbi:MAG: HEAT repeat domain-containing protein [Xanthobacteraceae bacterium]